uniref:C2H2-type domain-containing protein n=1 Tax=Clytia hemisphaerica TaxID=252671 RepID=A0A7M5X5Q0_9CNID|eukprot:TCONS_00051677-protein
MNTEEDEIQNHTKPKCIYHICVLCPRNKNFQTALELSHHLQTMHYYVTVIVCCFCNIRLPSMEAVDVHNEMAHTSEPIASTTYACGFCSKQFDKRSTLDNHLLNHYYTHFPDMRPFLCTTCGEYLFGIKQFITHLQEHFILCSVCFSLFKSPEGFFLHYKSSHSNQIKCATCLELIPDCNTYLSHLKRHDFKIPVLTDEFNHDKSDGYCCTVCDESFTSRLGFLNHFMQHSIQSADKNNNFL